jgi:hypothetical protein
MADRAVRKLLGNAPHVQISNDTQPEASLVLQGKA